MKNLLLLGPLASAQWQWLIKPQSQPEPSSQQQRSQSTWNTWSLRNWQANHPNSNTQTEEDELCCVEPICQCSEWEEWSGCFSDNPCLNPVGRHLRTRSCYDSSTEPKNLKKKRAGQNACSEMEEEVALCDMNTFTDSIESLQDNIVWRGFRETASLTGLTLVGMYYQTWSQCTADPQRTDGTDSELWQHTKVGYMPAVCGRAHKHCYQKHVCADVAGTWLPEKFWYSEGNTMPCECQECCYHQIIHKLIPSPDVQCFGQAQEHVDGSKQICDYYPDFQWNVTSMELMNTGVITPGLCQPKPQPEPSWIAPIALQCRTEEIHSCQTVHDETCNKVPYHMKNICCAKTAKQQCVHPCNKYCRNIENNVLFGVSQYTQYFNEYLRYAREMCEPLHPNTWRNEDVITQVCESGSAPSWSEWTTTITKECPRIINNCPIGEHYRESIRTRVDLCQVFPTDRHPEVKQELCPDVPCPTCNGWQKGQCRATDKDQCKGLVEITCPTLCDHLPQCKKQPKYEECDLPRDHALRTEYAKCGWCQQGSGITTIFECGDYQGSWQMVSRQQGYCQPIVDAPCRFDLGCDKDNIWTGALSNNFGPPQCFGTKSTLEVVICPGGDAESYTRSTASALKNQYIGVDVYRCSNLARHLRENFNGEVFYKISTVPEKCRDSKRVEVRETECPEITCGPTTCPQKFTKTITTVEVDECDYYQREVVLETRYEQCPTCPCPPGECKRMDICLPRDAYNPLKPERKDCIGYCSVICNNPCPGSCPACSDETETKVVQYGDGQKLLSVDGQCWVDNTNHRIPCDLKLPPISAECGQCATPGGSLQCGGGSCEPGPSPFFAENPTCGARQILGQLTCSPIIDDFVSVRCITDEESVWQASIDPSRLRNDIKSQCYYGSYQGQWNKIATDPIPSDPTCYVENACYSCRICHEFANVEPGDICGYPGYECDEYNKFRLVTWEEAKTALGITMIQMGFGSLTEFQQKLSAMGNKVIIHKEIFPVRRPRYVDTIEADSCPQMEMCPSLPAPSRLRKTIRVDQCGCPSTVVPPTVQEICPQNDCPQIQCSEWSECTPRTSQYSFTHAYNECVGIQTRTCNNPCPRPPCNSQVVPETQRDCPLRKEWPLECETCHTGQIVKRCNPQTMSYDIIDQCMLTETPWIKIIETECQADVSQPCQAADPECCKSTFTYECKLCYDPAQIDRFNKNILYEEVSIWELQRRFPQFQVDYTMVRFNKVLVRRTSKPCVVPQIERQIITDRGCPSDQEMNSLFKIEDYKDFCRLNKHEELISSLSNKFSSRFVKRVTKSLDVCSNTEMLPEQYEYWSGFDVVNQCFHGCLCENQWESMCSLAYPAEIGAWLNRLEDMRARNFGSYLPLMEMTDSEEGKLETMSVNNKQILFDFPPYGADNFDLKRGCGQGVCYRHDECSFGVVRNYGALGGTSNFVNLYGQKNTTQGGAEDRYNQILYSGQYRNFQSKEMMRQMLMSFDKERYGHVSVIPCMGEYGRIVYTNGTLWEGKNAQSEPIPAVEPVTLGEPDITCEYAKYIDMSRVIKLAEDNVDVRFQAYADWRKTLRSKGQFEHVQIYREEQIKNIINSNRYNPHPARYSYIEPNSYKTVQGRKCLKWDRYCRIYQSAYINRPYGYNTGFQQTTWLENKHLIGCRDYVETDPAKQFANCVAERQSAGMVYSFGMSESDYDLTNVQFGAEPEPADSS